MPVSRFPRGNWRAAITTDWGQCPELSAPLRSCLPALCSLGGPAQGFTRDQWLQRPWRDTPNDEKKNHHCQHKGKLQSTPSQPQGLRWWPSGQDSLATQRCRGHQALFPGQGAGVVLRVVLLSCWCLWDLHVLLMGGPGRVTKYSWFAHHWGGVWGVGLLVLESGQSRTHPRMWDCDAINRQAPHKEGSWCPGLGAGQVDSSWFVSAPVLLQGWLRLRPFCVLVPRPAWGLMSSQLLLLEHLSLLLEPLTLPSNLWPVGVALCPEVHLSPLECQPLPWAAAVYWLKEVSKWRWGQKWHFPPWQPPLHLRFTANPMMAMPLKEATWVVSLGRAREWNPKSTKLLCGLKHFINKWDLRPGEHLTSLSSSNVKWAHDSVHFFKVFVKRDVKLWIWPLV